MFEFEECDCGYDVFCMLVDFVGWSILCLMIRCMILFVFFRIWCICRLWMIFLML